jgi:hypothetical protein
MVPSHHVGNFLPKTKGFFSHDFTLIASVVGDSVIGHGIVGKDIPIMAHLAYSRPMYVITVGALSRHFKVRENE